MTTSIATTTNDPVVLRGLRRLAPAHVLDVVADLDGLAAPPAAVVVDLEQPGALDVVRRSRARWPVTLVAGFVSMPAGAPWRDAEAAGCDVVATRGALAGRLQDRLAEWARHPGGRRFPLVDLGDVAGRLGLVARVPDTPVGPVAVYHLGGELFAAGDVCPHAGALLSEGEVTVADALVTCPSHGSRFDVRTGARVRGPADDPIPVFRVAVEGTRAFLQVD